MLQNLHNVNDGTDSILANEADDYCSNNIEIRLDYHCMCRFFKILQLLAKQIVTNEMHIKIINKHSLLVT